MTIIQPTDSNHEVTYVQDDDLPENCHYCDRGCRLAPSCLNCPLPQCVYDAPAPQYLLKQQRNAQIVQLYTAGEGSIRELAQRYGLSVRSVQRIVKKSRESTAELKAEGDI
jgi:AraC-like DNA-binding protein